MLKLFMPICSEAEALELARLSKGMVTMSLIDEVCRDLHRLEPRQLETVGELVREFLYEAEGDEPEAETAGDEPEGDEGARGWVELKMIPRGNKSYGPYAYLRWREGKVTRSKYLGKVKSK